MKFLDVRGGLNPVGRPKTGPEASELAQWCANWIEHEWIEINAEDCPTGRQYKKVVGMFSKKLVYDQYVKAFSFTAHASNRNALSLTRFSVILDGCMKRLCVAVRQKKNVSGKCEGNIIVAVITHNFIYPSDLDCNKLTQQYNASSTRAEYDRWRDARNLHHQEIALYRSHYQADQLKSRSDSSFVCIGIDGADQATTYCPQLWSSHLHGDMPENSYIQQKVMGVVVHGTPDETIFYVTDPRVPHGMDLTTNCLLDVLTKHTDLRASTLRLQFDGLFIRF
jgi:hypothetical protein